MHRRAHQICQKKFHQLSTAVNQLSNLTFKICLITLLYPTESFKNTSNKQNFNTYHLLVYIFNQNLKFKKNQKSNIAQLRPQLKPAKNKINYIFGTIGHRLKILKAKLLRIKFPIELFNFYFSIKSFLSHLVPVKLNNAPARLSPSGFGSAQLSLLAII